MSGAGDKKYPGGYLILGGTALDVDTEQLRAMVAELNQAVAELDGLNGYLATERVRLEVGYLERLSELSAAAAAGSESAGAAIAQLQAAWGQYTSLSSTAEYGGDGVRHLGVETRELAVLLRRAAGLYELSENRVREVWMTDGIQIELMVLASLLVQELGFPPVFTVGGKRYYAADLTDAQKVAVILSWWQGKMGERDYGKSQSVTLRFAGGQRRIAVSGFEDSPELDMYFGVYLRMGDCSSWNVAQDWTDAVGRTTYQELWKRVSHQQVLPDTALGIGPAVLLSAFMNFSKELSRGKSPRDLKVSALITAFSQVLAKNQELGRRERDQLFAKSKTARAIGVEASERLAVKGLRVDDGTVLEENRDGSITRRFPREVGDIFRYAQTIDPKDGAAFEIQQWETTTGRRGARVVLRGTDSWDAGSVQLQDMLTNTEAVAGLRGGIQLAVAEALVQAGVSRDVPVELVGHSQAGIIASNLAADPSFTRRFNVKNVVTAGSPVANAKIPESVATLNLHNNGDVVPLTEASTNRVSPHHLTVRANYTMTTDLAKNHDAVHTYGAMADDLQRKHYAKYDNYLECRDKALGLDEKIVKATAQRFEVSRDYIPQNSKVKPD